MIREGERERKGEEEREVKQKEYRDFHDILFT